MTKGLLTLSENGNEILEAIHRFRNNESTYISYLHKFLIDPTYEQFKYCIQSKDFDHAQSYCSSLNGLASNLGLTKIAKCSARLSNILYSSSQEDLSKPLSDLEEAYVDTIALINQV